MDNPFSYTKIVTGPSFCNRKKEQKDIVSYIDNAQNILLYSNRRLGKTSLIHQIFSTKLDKKTKHLYIDLFGTLTERDFVTAVFKSFSQIETKTDKLLQLARDTFKHASITFSVDPVTGAATATPVFIDKTDQLYLEDVMSTVQSFSQQNKLVVVFDEFQEISNYSDGTFEKKLRKIVQHHSNISYIFSGSRRHLLLQMFHSQGRAFYKQAEPYPIDEIETEHYTAWARKLFKKKGVTIQKSLIEKIIAIAENQPMYVQRFLYHLWEEKDPDSKELVDTITHKIMERQREEYQLFWESLTLNQCKTLKLIVKNSGRDLFSADSLASVGLKTGSQVTKSLEALSNRDVIIKNTVYHVQDVMLKKWITGML